MVKPSPESSSSSRNDDPKYKGVRKRKWGKWVSEIRLPNSRERIWLGSYNSPEKAARAFDAALFCLRGRNASFNFPDNPPDIVGGQSLTPQEIQAVASRYGNDYEPPGEVSGSGRVLDGGVRAESETTADWSFLNYLDSSNESYSDFGYYPGFDNMGGGESYRPPEPSADDNVDENGGEAFCNPSFLWNF